VASAVAEGHVRLGARYYRYKYCYCALHHLDGNVRIMVPWLDPGGWYQVTDPLTAGC
jgi:hypothetical protein